MIHTPVLLKEIVKYLNLKPGMNVVDATLDGGGHAMAIADKIAPDGKMLGIEWDGELLKEFEIKNGFDRLTILSNSRMDQKSEFKNNVILVNDSYANIKNIVREYNFRPNGILFDLGLSSWHYERSGRGFSFRRDEHLDMRFNKKLGTKTAADIINTESRDELEKILRECGEEQFSKDIVKNIISTRRKWPITTTSALVEVISNSVPAWYKKRKIHFATKTFQALRIAVNDELKNVSDGVLSAIEALVSGGRLVVIAFHGLEDKLVREIFKKKAKEGKIKFVVRGTIRPFWEEIKSNPRARSAKMKVIEKL